MSVGTTGFRGDRETLAPTLRSLDAIHLAVALSLGDELRSVVTYAHRMGDAALASGLRCESLGG